MGDAMSLMLSDDQQRAIEQLHTAATLAAAYREVNTPYGLLSDVCERAGAALLEAMFFQDRQS